MAGEVFIVFCIFTAAVFIVRAIVDGIVRYRALNSSADAGEVLNALKIPAVPFHINALKWGLSLSCLGAGFLIIDALKLQPDQPSTWGVICISIAAGLLAFYGLVRRNML
jgi:uncharacterized membrane protein HdeD (DUF308 family)